MALAFCQHPLTGVLMATKLLTCDCFSKNWIYGFGEIHVFVLLAVFCFILELFLFARVDNSELWECKRDEWALSSLSIEG